MRDPTSTEPHYTSVAYGAGADTDAHSVAAMLSIEAGAYRDDSLAPNHIRVILGEISTRRTSRARRATTVPTSLPTTTAAVDQLGYETSTMPTPEVGTQVTARGGSIPASTGWHDEPMIG